MRIATRNGKMPQPREQRRTANAAGREVTAHEGQRL